MADNDMDEGRFAPVVDGEVVESVEKALVSANARNTMDEVDFGLLIALNRAEIDQKIATARAMPRVITDAKKRVLNLATLDEETAQDCGYVMPRGKDKETGKQKFVTGPSVALARIVAVCWGNARAGNLPASIDREAGVVRASASFHDLETNYEFTANVTRSIRGAPYQGRPGRLFSDDMIAVTANAANAIAFRNATFAVVPKPIWNPAYQATLDLIRGDVKTLSARREALLKSFKDRFEVTPDRVFLLLGVKGADDIGLDELVSAQGFYTSIKNKEVTIEDLLKDVTKATAPATKGLGDAFGTKPKLAAPRDEPKPKPEPKAEPKPEPELDPEIKHDPETGEIDDAADADAKPEQDEAADTDESASYEAIQDLQTDLDSSADVEDVVLAWRSFTKHPGFGEAKPADVAEVRTQVINRVSLMEPDILWGSDPDLFELWLGAQPVGSPAVGAAHQTLIRSSGYKALPDGEKDRLSRLVAAAKGLRK